MIFHFMYIFKNKFKNIKYNIAYSKSSKFIFSRASAKLSLYIHLNIYIKMY